MGKSSISMGFLLNRCLIHLRLDPMDRITAAEALPLSQHQVVNGAALREKKM